MAKKGKKKQVNSVIRTQATKEYRQLLQEVDKTTDKYAEIISRSIGKNKDEISNEIQAIYLDNLRKADDPVALMKENLVNLMLKKQTTDYLKEHLYNKTLKEAQESDDEDKVKEIEAQMMDDLMINEFDLKVHKAIQESVKAIEKSGPREINVNSVGNDDNIVLDLKNDD